MAVIDGTIGYRILRIIAPAEPTGMNGGSYAGRSKIEVLLGDKVWQDIKDKVVVDFGCGAGAEAIELSSAWRRASLWDRHSRALACCRERARREGKMPERKIRQDASGGCGRDRFDRCV